MTKLLLSTTLFLAPLAAQVFGVLNPAAQWFMDSGSGGSDANSGQSILLPLKTLPALLAKSIQAGDVIAFKCGSKWKATFGPGVRVTMITYGACPATPDDQMFDGSEVISSGAWSASGTANCYMASVTQETPGSAGFVNVFEAGVILPRVASIAACGSTAGSVFVTGDTSAPTTVYVHPAAGGNPASNGITYEFTARTAEISVPTGSVLSGIGARRTSGAQGVIVGGDDVAIVNSVANEGARHNILVGKNPYLRNVIARDGYNTGGTSLYVYFVADAQLSPATFIDTQAIKTSVSPIATGGYDGHVSGGVDFGQVLFLRASCVNAATCFAARGYTVICDGCTSDGSSTAGANDAVTDVIYKNGSFLNNTQTAISPAAGSTLIQNMILSAPGLNAINSITATTSLSITDSTVTSAATYLHFFAPLGSFTNLRNTVTVSSRLWQFSNTPTLNSDYNTLSFGSGTPVTLNGGPDITWAAYKAATGQDAHSTP